MSLLSLLFRRPKRRPPAEVLELLRDLVDDAESMESGEEAIGALDRLADRAEEILDEWDTAGLADSDGIG